MIKNKPAPKMQSALEAIESCSFEVYLGGSRRMAELQAENFDFDTAKKHLIKITDATDYDFYVTDSPEVQAWLIDAGFEMHVEEESDDKNGDSSHQYDWYTRDKMTTSVWSKFDNRYGANVEVALKTDADVYHAIFESISPAFFYKYLWKSSPIDKKKKPLEKRNEIVTMMNLFYKSSEAVLALYTSRAKIAASVPSVAPINSTLGQSSTDIPLHPGVDAIMAAHYQAEVAKENPQLAQIVPQGLSSLTGISVKDGIQNATVI